MCPSAQQVLGGGRSGSLTKSHPRGMGLSTGLPGPGLRGEGDATDRACADLPESDDVRDPLRGWRLWWLWRAGFGSAGVVLPVTDVVLRPVLDLDKVELVTEARVGCRLTGATASLGSGSYGIALSFLVFLLLNNPGIGSDDSDLRKTTPSN